MSYILVVETEAEIRKFVAICLQRRGFEVAQACTAQDVLDQMRQRLPDAVVLDTRLIGMSGWELLQILKEDAALSVVPVVLMTATPSSENADAKRKYVNIITQLTKPLSANHLVAAVERAIGTHSAT